MNDDSRVSKWVLVIGMVVLAILILWPPHEKLKGGIDLVGGVSLLYEIDTTGLDPVQQRDLSSRVISILKDRVDPKGQKNLEWIPIGDKRLEVRLPRPPKEAFDRRDAYNGVKDKLAAKNIKRREIETALNTTGDKRTERLSALIRGVVTREPLVEELISADQAYRSAQGGMDQTAVDSTLKNYEQAMTNLLSSSMPKNRLNDILEATQGDKRDTELAKLRLEYPDYDSGTESDPDGKLISKAIVAYDAWAKNKADLEDPSDLKRLLRGAGVLEYRILADRDPNSPDKTQSASDPRLVQSIAKYTNQLARYGPRKRTDDRYIWLPVEDVVRFMTLDSMDDYEAQKANPVQPIVEEYTGRHYVLAHDDPEYCLLKGTGRNRWKLSEAYADRDPMTGRNVVSFSLDPRGGQLFGELTGNNINRSLCIVMDGAAMSHANIISRINQRGQITGNFTAERVQSLVRVLEAGSLPARLKETPLKETTIGPKLGESNRKKGISAAIYGSVMVFVFMLFYYGLAAGGMANLALALNMLFLLSIMALLQATFTLPGIAGLILTIGMAVDANVLIFERIREERDRGVIFMRALNAGYDKAFSTIMDANITTLIICVILGFVGSEEVKGFAMTLGIGITTSMFTSLFVTRLIFNTLIAKGLLKDLSMRRIIGVPTIDWLALRSKFWPVSIVTVVMGLTMFLGFSTYKTESMYDIEFLGGTSLQVDLKKGVTLTDEEMRASITGEGNDTSAAGWLLTAADHLANMDISTGALPGQYIVSSSALTGDQIAALTRITLEQYVDRGGINAHAHQVEFDTKVGELDLDAFNKEIVAASEYAKEASTRLKSARVQSVRDLGSDEDAPLSYEIVTIETQRELVQAAIMAIMGEKLSVQQSLTYEALIDEDFTREPYFLVEMDDQYLSEVIGGDATFDVMDYRGGVAVEVVLDPQGASISVAKLEKRLKEVGLQPEFEQYDSRDIAVLPLGDSETNLEGKTGYWHFALLTTDDSFRYDEDDIQWTESLAKPHLAQIEAALGQEKSLSKVIQFAPQIAGQTKNRAIFAIVLALAAIVSYLWLRFGTKEYGLAAIVALVHDVGITLGLVALSQLVAGSLFGRALLIDAFRVDLPMIAAILTVIGYSLNDTIVVFDRIRENKGRISSLNPNIINNSINQCLSRTLLTSITTFMVVATLYVAGGKGVHGFSFALLIGIVVGTYSSVGIAAPLLYRPRVLHAVVVVMVALVAIGMIVLLTPGLGTVRLVLTGIAAAIGLYSLMKIRRGAGDFSVGGRMARA